MNADLFVFSIAGPVLESATSTNEIEAVDFPNRNASSSSFFRDGSPTRRIRRDQTRDSSQASSHAPRGVMSTLKRSGANTSGFSPFSSRAGAWQVATKFSIVAAILSGTMPFQIAVCMPNSKEC